LREAEATGHEQADEDGAGRLQPGDAVGLERDDGEWMKGVVVTAAADGVDVVADGHLHRGEALALSHAVREDARYTAPVEVVDEAPGRARVRLTGPWQRWQMREFVRVDGVGLRVGVHDASRHAARRGRRAADRARRAGDAPPTHAGGEARLLDLSVGGLRFASDALHATGDVLELELHLPRVGPVAARGEVLRVAGRRSEDAGARQYAVRFCGLEESTRVKIMTWVCAEQSRRFRAESG